MSIWICKAKQNFTMDSLEQYTGYMDLENNDEVYVYSDDYESGNFKLKYKFLFADGTPIEDTAFTEIDTDLPYSVLYKTKSSLDLIKLTEGEIVFVLGINNVLPCDEDKKIFKNFLYELDIEADLLPTGISDNIIFNIGQPNTGKSFKFEESRLFDLALENKYKYKKIPVSGGIGNEYKGLQNTDLAITYDPVKKELRFGEFLQILMSAISNPKVPHVVFLDDFHNQDISSLLSEYTPLFKGQQKRKIKELTDKNIFNEEFSSTDDFIKQWNGFIKSHCAEDVEDNAIPKVELTNRVSGDALILVFPSNFYLLGAANFNENTLNIFADWEDRANITHIDPIENFAENFELPGNATDNTKSFLKCCTDLNSQLKKILKEDKDIFNYKQYCFGMWKIVDSKSKIITEPEAQEKLIDFLFGMIKNSLKFNNKTSEINEIGKKLIEKMQESDDTWFKDNIESNMNIDKEILHKHNIYEDEI